MVGQVDVRRPGSRGRRRGCPRANVAPLDQLRPGRPPHDDHAGHQGLDLGARPALPGVRVRRARVRPRARSAGAAARERAGWRDVLAGPDVAAPADPTTGRRWSTPATSATSPALRRAAAADADPGRPALPELGPGRHRVAARYGEQDPAQVGRSWSTAATRWPTASTGSSGDQWAAHRAPQRRRGLHVERSRATCARPGPPPVRRDRRTAPAELRRPVRAPHCGRHAGGRHREHLQPLGRDRRAQRSQVP